jgi:hypothetical protein
MGVAHRKEVEVLPVVLAGVEQPLGGEHNPWLEVMARMQFPLAGFDVAVHLGGVVPVGHWA